MLLDPEEAWCAPLTSPHPSQAETLPALVLIIRRGRAVLIYAARNQEEEGVLRDLARDLGPSLAQLQKEIDQLNH